MATTGRSVWAAVGIGMLAGSPALGQWVQQSFTIQPGWNSVYLEVDPAPKMADDLFAGLPIESVWMRAPDSLTANQEPDCTGPTDPNCFPQYDTQWRVWVPVGDPGRLLINLRLIRGGAYLIKASGPFEWVVVGRPNGTKTQWREGYNLAGFHVVSDGSPTPSFQSYLAPSMAHDNTEVYRKLNDGSLAPVSDLLQSITPGRGYWVKADSDMEYDGPLSIDNMAINGLDFGRDITRLTLGVANESGSVNDVHVDFMPSAAPPVGQPDVLPNAGNPEVIWQQIVQGALENVIQWNLLAAAPISAMLAGSGDTASARVFQLGLDRAAMGGQGAYQGILRVRNSEGFRRYVGVVADVAPQTGLWVGYVQLGQVAWGTAGARVVTDTDAGNDYENPVFSGPGPDTDTSTLRDTGTIFAFPVIIHQSDMGEYKLLTEVALMEQPGDLIEQPINYVLVTPACPPGVCNTLSPGDVVNSQQVTRRFASAAYAFDGDLSAGGGDFSSGLVFDIFLPGNHKLNPFKHRFHPDHNCDEPGECYDVQRQMIFTFDPQAVVSDPSAGFSTLGGTYLETLTISYIQMVTNEACGCDMTMGVCAGGPNDGSACATNEDCGCVIMIPHAYTTQAGGRFTLRRVSEIARLNDVQ